MDKWLISWPRKSGKAASRSDIEKALGQLIDDSRSGKIDRQTFRARFLEILRQFTPGYNRE